MNVLPLSRSLNALRALRMPVAALLFFLPTLLSAQEVPVTTDGIVGIISGVPPKYSGQYVLQMTEYGFFWLDTSALSGGHIQAVSKCVGGFPPSDSGYYVIADCNTITSISASGSLSLVRMYSGQCIAQRGPGCSGPRSDGHVRFTFGLGTWDYKGDLGEIPNSTDTTDPLGRTWSIRPLDASFRHFSWQVVGGGVTNTPSSTPTPAFTPTPTPTPTPGPGVSATNLSSQLRGDSVNYYGDKWRLQDVSNPSPTTRTDWDFIYSGSFHPDEGGTPGPPDNEGTVTGYFPCDPNGVAQGTFRTGASCIQSLGLTNPPATGSYQFSMLSSVSATPFISPAFQVACPQAGIVGYAGFSGTCVKTGGTLTVVTGGNADASPSKGNLTEAVSFDWDFTGGSPIHVSGKIVPVPSGATGFTLTIIFPGGSTATASGSVTIVDSTPVLGIFTDSAATIPAFFGGGAFQLNAGTTYYLKDTESTPPPSAHFFFNNGASEVELPGSPTAGPGPLSWTPAAPCLSNCSVKVSVGLVSSSSPVSISSSAPTPVPTPVPTATPIPGSALTVSVAGPTSGSRGVGLPFSASASGGTGSYSYSWNCAYVPSFPSFSPGGSTTTCTYATAGVYTVVAKVDSGGSSAVSAGNTVTITGLPAPSSQSTLSGPTLVFNPLNGRYSASNGSPITFTANETSATSYAWDFGDGTSAATKSAVKTYTAAGSYTARLTVTGDETNTSGTASTTIPLSITGPPLPSTAYTVTGASQTGANAYTAEAGRAITFTAGATQASTFAWDFGDGTSAATQSAVKTYSAAGARTVRLTVTGDGTNTSGTASVDIAMTLTPPTFRAVIVPGVAHLDDGTTTWGTDVSVTDGGTASMNIRLAFVPFSDSGASSLDLTQLNYGDPIALSPGQSFSIIDVVAALNGGNNKGTLVIKYAPGTRAPLVSARVYFQPKVNPANISYGSGIPAYEVDGSGRITPQGFISAALSAPPSGLGTESTEAALDVALTVNMTGTGSGTVTSDPAGINCPSTCSFNFPAGSSVTLIGAASPGSIFYDFVSGCDAKLFGQCQVVLSTSKSVTARFDSSGPAPTPTPGPTNVTLTVTKAGTGSGTVSSTPSGISCGVTCSATFAQAEAVTLTAAPDSGSTFSGWGGACSGTGSCSLTLSADLSATATFTAAGAPPPPSGDQYLVGLRSDTRYRFVVTLFNAGGTQGNFELRATDDQGALILILDASGSRVAVRKFNNLGPYQQVYLRDSDLGLDDGKPYVLKATATKGTLLAFGTALDRKTNDLVQISDDSQPSPAEDEIVSYWVAGVSRYNTTYGAHWRTDMRIFNRSSSTRNVYFEYFFTSDGVTERRAHVDKVPIAAGSLLTYDDIVSSLLSQDSSVDLSGNTAGILRVYYGQDADSATRPLIIGSRNYNDDPTGTAGSQLSVYTNAQAGSASRDLFLTGVEDSPRYASKIGIFTMDPGQVSFRIVAVAPDGTEVGSFSTGLGGVGPRFGQISLTDENLKFTNPGKPVSIRIDRVSGGRVGAYAFTVDKVTLDTNFLQALPLD